MHNNQPLILIEAKSHTENLDIHATQLERYFTVTESRFAILTNGIEYRFFTDLEKPNKMDTTPFFVFNILNMKDRDLKELEKFTSANLDIDKIPMNAPIIIIPSKAMFVTPLLSVMRPPRATTKRIAILTKESCNQL